MKTSQTQIIDKQINDIKDWRGDLLKKLRKIILSTDTDLIEEYKWGVPVYSKHGLVCAISHFNDHVKMNFFQGVNLKDKDKLLNSGLTSKNHRAIDFNESNKIDKVFENKLKDLIKEAIRYNS